MWSFKVQQTTSKQQQNGLISLFQVGACQCPHLSPRDSRRGCPIDSGVQQLIASHSEFHGGASFGPAFPGFPVRKRSHRKFCWLFDARIIEHCHPRGGNRMHSSV